MLAVLVLYFTVWYKNVITKAKSKIKTTQITRTVPEQRRRLRQENINIYTVRAGTCTDTSQNNLHVCTVHQQYQDTILLFQTDAHNYKIIEILKTIKIPTIAPTCFGSRRNHHQGAISCLAKITNMILCARRYVSNDEHIEVVLGKHEIAP